MLTAQLRAKLFHQAKISGQPLEVRHRAWGQECFWDLAQSCLKENSELSVPVRRAGSFVSAIILQSDHHTC